MIYRQDIKKAFEFYNKLSPLDIKTEKELSLWQEDYQLDILQYSRIVADLRDCKNINETINTDYDFDNLFIVIESLIQSGNLKIEKEGGLHWNGLKKNFFEKRNDYYKVFEKPNSNFNQFPCTIDSREKRIELFYNSFPYVEKMYIGIFGDDDFLSIELYKTGIYIPIVYELDTNVIEIITKETNGNVKIINGDILDKNYKIDLEIDSFISDPPYNINGLVNFTNFGIRQLNNKTKEFFLIFNKMMVGEYYYDFIKYLSLNHNAYLINTIISFSKYNFPKHYRELEDLNNCLKKYDISFNEKNISSSSSVFHFKISEGTKKSHSNLIYKRYLGYM